MIFTGRKATAVGLAGSVLAAVGAFGAGATLVHDPVLAATIFDLSASEAGRTFGRVLLYAGIVLVLLAWVQLGRLVRAGVASMREVVWAAGLWCAPLLLAPPLFSNDLYTYLAQAAVADAGLDPYTHVPAEIAGPFADNAPGRWLHIGTPYGPLHVLLAKSVLAVTGENVLLASVLLRLVVVSGLALVCVALPVLCRHFGTRQEQALWLTVANPLVVLCVVSGGHNDLLMVGLLVAGAALVLSGRQLAGFASVALAAAVKAPAALVLPFLVWVWAAQRAGGRVSLRSYVPVFAASVSTVVGTFGLCSLAAGVDLGWLRNLSGNTEMKSVMSLPTSFGRLVGVLVGDEDAAVAVCRVVGGFVLAGVLTWLWWRARSGGVAAVRLAAIALLAAVVLSPVVLPWYFMWSLMLAAAALTSPRYVAIVAGCSTLLLLCTPTDGSTHPPLWTFVLFLAAAVTVGLVTARRASVAVPSRPEVDRPRAPAPVS